MDCQICCEEVPSVVACVACQYRTCRGCARRLTETSASCAMCGRPWCARECRARLGITFYRTTYRKRQQARCLQRELRLAPQAHAHVATERQRRSLRYEIRHAVRAYRVTLVDEIVPHIRALQNALRALNSTQAHENGDLPAGPSAGLCPRPGCRGLLSEAGVCGTCDQAICTRCGMTAHPGECSEEVLLSANLVRETARACPGCGAPSVRSEGCPTMWCAACHVFWNWDTRRLIPTRGRAVPHNPDHRAWLATGGSYPAREMQDLPCGGFPDTSLVHRRILMYQNANHPARLDPNEGVPDTNVSTVVYAIHSLQEAQLVVRPRYPRVDTSDTLFRMRVAYLLGDYRSDDAYAANVESHDRSQELKAEVAQILETFVHSGLDLVQRFATGCDDLRCTAQQLLVLHELTRAALVDCSVVWGRKVPSLRPSWGWVLPNTRSRR